MKLSDVKGLKEKRIAELEKAGITTPMDLLSYFPVEYVDLNNLTDFSSVDDGEKAVFCAVFSEKPKTAYVRKNLCITKVRFEVENKTVLCTWFNQKYFASSVIVGSAYYIIGKVKKNGNVFEITNPKTVRRDKCNGRFLVYYKPLKGLPSSVIASAEKTLLERVNIVSFIPEKLRAENELMTLTDAYKAIHFPTTLKTIDAAKRSISVEYLNYTLCVYSIIKQKSGFDKKRRYAGDVSLLENAVRKLPFSLTADQITAARQILSDMNGNNRMNRLLQGDVGSGKTVVAFIAMYYAFLSGYQSVLMCPTELLARQHYNTLVRLFPDVENCSCALYSGLSKSERRDIIDSIGNGTVKFIIGTHAVFSDDVEFNDLALTVTDEQHRFGVNQRSSLENKTCDADCLVMSATPIPRTLALTLYGDLNQSLISAPPRNKAETVTRIVPERKINDMWRYFVECASRDERTYVVCPRIDEDDDDEELISCKKLYSDKKKLGNYVGLIHGQMSDKEKTEVMADFVCGNVKILISTTVIEVGIDVPEAVNIAVYNPERYGLSQLHQLRGRVGRGNKKSYCFLISSPASESAAERLEYLKNCGDGFALAEYDFNTRGAGDFLGSAQHGKGDMIINSENISVAKRISREILERTDISDEIALTIGDNRYDYYKNITLN